MSSRSRKLSLIESLEGRRLLAGVFQEAGGLVVAEIESEPANGWTRVTSPAGYTGSAAYQWNGPNYFGSPGRNVLKYEFNINNAGTYNLDLRSYNPFNDNKEFNDVFIRVDGGQWFKTFTYENKKWTYVTRKEVRHHVFEDYRVNLSKGRHTVEISARSSGYIIDRLVLFKDGVNGQNPSIPQSPTSGAPNPDPDPNPNLAITSFSLINADTNQVISGFSNFSSSRTIRLNSLPTRNLAIRANTPSGIASVKFVFDGRTRIESVKPFAVLGDNNGDFNGFTAVAGKTYKLSATGYSGPRATGSAGPTLSLDLRFT
ncbi:MAG: hypothetical protein NZ561_02980 [Phycisphaerae bacterium]|nr:hypothetical protein [Phycisphaerae bacterium]MDW8260891.1 hypothetical protein [Phycisphaerales bacterium]